MIRQTEWTGCQGCGYFQKLLDIPAECRNPIWRKLRPAERRAILTGQLPCPWHTLRDKGMRSND